MFLLKIAGNTTRMSVAAPMVNVLLRRKFIQSHLILIFAMIKSKKFLQEEIRY